VRLTQPSCGLPILLALSVGSACTVPDVDIVMGQQDSASRQQGDASTASLDTQEADTPVVIGGQDAAATWRDATGATCGSGKCDSGGSSTSSCHDVPCPSTDEVCLGNSCVQKPTAIAAGGDHTCVVTGGSVLCWGGNANGELGVAAGPPKTSPVVVAGLTNVKALAAGTAFTCALIADGTVRCWGDNSAGQLGSSTAPSSATPVDAGVSGVETLASVPTLAAGRDFACARTTDGKVWCWGNNSVGQLGRTAAALYPTCRSPVSPGKPDIVANLTSAVSISAGADVACAVLQDLSVSCWGGNETLQLGTVSTSAARSTPGPVSSLADATQVVATTPSENLPSFSCNVTVCSRLSSNSVSCWGDSSLLGSSQILPNQNQPVPVSSLQQVSDLAAGSDFVCSVVAGEVWCWGMIPSATDSTVEPAKVTGVNSVTKIAAGANHICALITDGTVKCWGNSSLGQLGNGTIKSSLAPVSVL